MPIRTYKQYNKEKDENKDQSSRGGYGNIGRYSIEALEAAPDFEIAGVVRRQGDKDKPLELTPYEVSDEIAKLNNVDVDILATSTRSCPEYAERLVAMGINTVDSYDIHTGILDYRTSQMEHCKKAGRVSVVSAGWDPGSDSVVRVLMESLAPKGLSYTNFGPAMPEFVYFLPPTLIALSFTIFCPCPNGLVAPLFRLKCGTLQVEV